LGAAPEVRAASRRDRHKKADRPGRVLRGGTLAKKCGEQGDKKKTHGNFIVPFV